MCDLVPSLDLTVYTSQPQQDCCMVAPPENGQHRSAAISEGCIAVNRNRTAPHIPIVILVLIHHKAHFSCPSPARVLCSVRSAYRKRVTLLNGAVQDLAKFQ